MATQHGKPLPDIRRFITTHGTDGKAVFDKALPEDAQWADPGIGARFFLAYTFGGFPVSLPEDADLSAFRELLAGGGPGSFMVPGGGLVRYVDYQPGCPAVWHRTMTADVGVVVEGEIELELDSGERRIMRRGDVCVQRGTMHCWRNPSDAQVARVLYVALSATPAEVNGQVMKEDLGVLAG